ncbi:Ca2+:H+ antiporter [Neorhizobium huautlense]|uniref:Ca2+:H+ antiporter n=1 Tax=Neorhizobium huautlense TaxID=67774 RepID=A0ABT9PZX2_9HYPH|nr:calcium:proton antiporter [Neorhizobium huautlense]MDP9840029.1 Ca2+:H+ antiporter [Neorhizobium huautlense]
MANIAALPKQEKSLVLAALVAIACIFVEHSLLEAGKVVSLIAAAVLIGVIVLASTRVAHHAEILAHKVGDPYGTMILTLSAVAVEVMILAIMLGSSTSPTLVRDTIYSAVMLDINGILGLAALLGGLRHGEQPYNDNSGKTYGVMILTAMGISMIVPEFVPDDRWHYYSGFTIIAMIALYALFLKMQVGPHSYFFSYSYKKTPQAAVTSGGNGPAGSEPLSPQPATTPAASPSTEKSEEASASVSIGVILFGVVVIGFLAEFMAAFLGSGLEGTSAPPALMAVIVASISAAPEILTALRAALRNRMQSVINIAMGASLSTVILTVPVMEAIALYTGQPFVMAMTPVQTVMVVITLIVAAINLNDGETNAIEGMTHFVLFATFIMLTVLGL